MNNIYVPDRRIVLPTEVDGRLKTLARLNQETSGVLLYKRLRSSPGLDLRVDSLYMTGRGKKLEVGIDPDRKSIIDYFLEHHPEYGSIEWHAHVTGNRELSVSDRTHYTEELREDQYFLAMVITPNGRTTIKSKDSGVVRTNVVPTPNEFYPRERYLQEQLEEFKKTLSLDHLPKFRATRNRR